MKVSNALELVWRWKQQVYQDIKDMTSAQRVAYFQKAHRRLEAKTGLRLDLPHAARRRSK